MGRDTTWDHWLPPVHRDDVASLTRPVPLFPVTSFQPNSECPHCGDLAKGSPFICMVCHQGGFDHVSLPGLRPDQIRETEYYAQNWLDLSNKDREVMWAEAVEVRDSKASARMDAAKAKDFIDTIGSLYPRWLKDREAVTTEAVTIYVRPEPNKPGLTRKDKRAAKYGV